MKHETERIEGTYPRAYTLRKGPVSVEVWFDQDAYNPRKEYDCYLGKMVCDRGDYELGDPNTGDLLEEIRETGSPEATYEYLREEYGATVVMPLYLFDHSGISMSTGAPFSPADSANHNAFDPGGWDTSMVGFIFDTEESRKECGTPLDRVESVLDGEVEEYSLYLEGRVYYFNGEGHDGDGECIGGYYGEEAVNEAAEQELDRLYDLYSDDVGATLAWAQDMGRTLPDTWITTGVAV